MANNVGRHRDPATVGMSKGLAALLAVVSLSGGVGIAMATDHVLSRSDDSSSTGAGDILAGDTQTPEGAEEGRPGHYPDATTTIPVGDGSTPGTSSTPSTTTRTPSTVTLTTRKAPSSSASTESDTPRTTAATPRTAATSPKPPSSSGGSSSAGTMGAAALEVLRITNVERARAGCGPVKGNSLLTKAAYLHSKDMAVNNYFAHDSQDGRTMGDRIKAVGYPKGTLGENIAAGQRTAAEVMNGWMNSPGHKANILNCSYTELGVGYYVGGSYGHYWTQDFGG